MKSLSNKICARSEQKFNKLLCVTVLLLITMTAYKAHSLDIEGNGTEAEREGLVALYLFNETSGSTVNDSITAGGQLNLTIDNPSAVVWGGGALEISAATAVRSAVATKVINACKASNEITIEAWIESRTQNDLALDAYGPARILTLSNGITKADRTPASGGFFIGQNYDAGHQYSFGINTTTRLNRNEIVTEGALLETDSSDRSIVTHNTRQHIYFTKNKEGLAKIYIDDKFGVPILRTQMSLPNSSLANLSDTFTLTLANEPKYQSDSGLTLLRDTVPNIADRTIEDKDWRGKYYMLAVYCKALSETQILGSRAPTDWLTADVNTEELDVTKPITSKRMLARQIYSRLVGYNIPIYHSTLQQMEDALSTDANNIENRMRAAAIATSKPGFYNRTVKDFAKKMSNRDETVDVPLNDFAATVVGATRDSIDARDLLRGDFYYRADTSKAAVPSDLINDLLISNRHYESVEMLNYDLQRVLIKQNGQSLYNGMNSTVPAANYDAAGLLTSRAFLGAHAIAGTNRRLVEFSFQVFMCREITQWADNTAPDSYVGRDVDRFPTGSHPKYQTSCRGCHGQMDALRGAFARITFETGFVKHAWVVNQDAETNPDEANNNENISTMVQVPRGISGKMNKNNTMFEQGKVTEDSSWINYANRGANELYFGWKPDTLQGRGIKDFGNMIAESKAFAHCMTERVFQSVCKRKPASFDAPVIQRVTDKFKGEDTYSLRKLFERMAVQPECLGE